MYRVSGSFSLPVRGSFRLSLAVLVHYRSLGVVSLGRWSSPDSQGLARDPWYLGTRQEPVGFCLRGYHPLWLAFPGPFCYPPVGNSSVLNRTSPATPPTNRRFRLFPVRSPLLRESLLISFPPGTEMFHFPGLSSPAYLPCRSTGLQLEMARLSTRPVASFGNPRIKAYLQLPEAYRSLSRPSSASGAKASTLYTK